MPVVLKPSQSSLKALEDHLITSGGQQGNACRFHNTNDPFWDWTQMAHGIPKWNGMLLNEKIKDIKYGNITKYLPKRFQDLKLKIQIFSDFPSFNHMHMGLHQKLSTLFWNAIIP